MGFSAEALFTSDGTYSGSSKSDTSEGQYETGRRTEERQDEDGVEELGFPHKTLERAVTQLQGVTGVSDKLLVGTTTTPQDAGRSTSVSGWYVDRRMIRQCLQ